MSLSRILRYNQRNNKTTASLTAEHAYSDNWAYSVSLGDPTSVGANMAAKTGEALNKSYDSVFSSFPVADSVPRTDFTASSRDDENTDVQKLTTSWMENIDTKMPENISKIDSNIISSPMVSKVEARFIVPKGRLRKNSTDFTSSFSNSLSLPKSYGKLIFFTSKKNSSSTKKNLANDISDNKHNNNSSNTIGHNIPVTTATATCDEIACTSTEHEYNVYEEERMFTTRVYSLEDSVSSLSTNPLDDTYSEAVQVNTIHIEDTESTAHIRKHSYTTSLSSIKRLFKITSFSNNNSNSCDHQESTVADDCAISSSLKETTSSPVSTGSFSLMIENEDSDRDQIIQALYSNIEASTDLVSRKYRDLDVVLGEGSGGKVKLVQRVLDNKVFALKEYRSKKKRESERKYIKNIISEYCIASTLKNPNICETLEILYEKGKIFQILEYCEYDLFSLVMSEKMHYEEICCLFKQLINGVKYLHDIGLSHRDLKLDNCVVTRRGILKLIDFGASSVFHYPLSSQMIEANGIVGSEPYLSPEVFYFNEYDPRALDVWSVGIIFFCMITRRFPWKYPKVKDVQFKAFCSGRGVSSFKDLVTRPVTDDSNNYDNDGYEEGVIDMGPNFILHKLPEETHKIMRRILEVSPFRRITINGILQDGWIKEIETCQVVGAASPNEASLRIINKGNHIHTNIDQRYAHIGGLHQRT
nr:AAC_HP1_G0007640.mRNA.1.CDS.1 [Saccharomyces cerevisiae]